MTIYILETGYLEARVADSPHSYLNIEFNFKRVCEFIRSDVGLHYQNEFIQREMQ